MLNELFKLLLSILLTGRGLFPDAANFHYYLSFQTEHLVQVLYFLRSQELFVEDQN